MRKQHEYRTKKNYTNTKGSLSTSLSLIYIGSEPVSLGELKQYLLRSTNTFLYTGEEHERNEKEGNGDKWPFITLKEAAEIFRAVRHVSMRQGNNEQLKAYVTELRQYLRKGDLDSFLNIIDDLAAEY